MRAMGESSRATISRAIMRGTPRKPIAIERK